MKTYGFTFFRIVQITIILLLLVFSNHLGYSQQGNPPAMNVDVGPDTIFCYSMAPESYYLGTNLVIENGHPPYRYAWECKVVYGGYLEFGAGFFLHDTTSPAPYFKEPLENNSSQKFILHVWDNQGNYAKDSMYVRFSQFGYLLGNQVHFLAKGDSVLFTPGSINVGGGVPPLTYRWSPSIGLADTFSITTWCKPEISRNYFVIARDSAGCVSEPSLAHQVFVSQVGTETTERHWDLFVPGRNSYYIRPSDNTYLVETFHVDSIRMEDGKEFLYFNAGTLTNHDCSWEFRYLYNDFLYMKNPHKIDSLIFHSDTVLFIDKYGYNTKVDTFIFKPFAKVGESWITNGTNITCEKILTMEIFGKPDSVKTFKYKLPGSDTAVFILSKSHGFIQFPPLGIFLGHFNNEPFPPDFKLAGYSDSTASAGYIRPNFNDYFNLQPGDLLFWEYRSEPDDIWIPRTTDYYVDTITYAYHSPDTVVYEFNRKIYKSNGNTEGPFVLTTSFTRDVEGLMLRNPTSWPGFIREYETEWFVSGPVFLEIDDKDTISYYSFNFEGLTKVPSQCAWHRIPDMFSRVTFSSREGLVSREMYNWGAFTTTLIGSIIDGEKRGTTEITTGINAGRKENILVFPNPAFDELRIKSGSGKMKYYELIDISGRLRSSGWFTESVSLDISNLPEGFYFITINDEANHERDIRKVIIQR